MAEYINKDRLYAIMGLLGDECKKPIIDQEHENRSYNSYYGWEVVRDVEDAIFRGKCQGEDVAPVVHGRWIEKPFLLGTSNFCSLCDSFYGMPHGKFNYCPNCGAKMMDGAE